MLRIFALFACFLALACGKGNAAPIGPLHLMGSIVPTTPVGPAGGGLGGNYPNPAVVGLDGGTLPASNLRGLAASGDCVSSSSDGGVLSLVCVKVTGPDGGVYNVAPFEVTNLTSAGNGVYTAQKPVATTDATPSTAMSFAIPANTAGNVTVITSAHKAGTAEGLAQTWLGYVVNNGGTCTTMATGGAFALSGTAGTTAGLSAATLSVGLSSCNVVATATGIAATNINWSSSIQYVSAS